MSETLIDFKQAAIEYERGGMRRPAILPVDLAVHAGEFITLVGPSGCGKSTLLNLVAGFATATEGQVLFRGKPIKHINTDVGYMTQSDALLPWQTTEQNVALPLILRGIAKREAHERACEVLKSVGLLEHRHLYPKELSGGMRKRAALAQILVYRPSTILMDEPFGALDAQLRLQVQQEMMRIVEAGGVTVLFVTHDVEEAVVLADRVLVFGGRPGRITRNIPVELPRPRKVLEIRTDPLFRDLFEVVWNELVPSFAEEMEEAA